MKPRMACGRLEWRNSAEFSRGLSTCPESREVHMNSIDYSDPHNRPFSLSRKIISRHRLYLCYISASAA